MESGDPLFELLLPQIPPEDVPTPELASTYLARLTSLPLSAIKTTEPESLAAAKHSANISLQSLASRSYRSIISSASHLSTLSESVSELSTSLSELKSALPDLDDSITTFQTTYARDSPTLKKRAEQQLLHANLERLLDILHLPSLLQSLIAAANYPTALDTLAHVRRLKSLYPNSPTIESVHTDCEALQKTLTVNLLSTLRGALKLPVAMKTVGFLRRATSATTDERSLRGIFLVCRLAYLNSLLSALSPLQALADEESNRKPGRGNGIQTERYLKRWLEAFREQSFGVVSMYRSIFPGALSTPGGGTSTPQRPGTPPPSGMTPPLGMGEFGRSSHSRSSSSFSAMAEEDPEGGALPDPIAGFTSHLVSLLITVLRTYLANIEEKSVRESLLTQVLYASGSLGRLGGEFAGVMASLPGVFGCGDLASEEEEHPPSEQELETKREDEYVGVVGRQKVLAGRLEAMAAGR
ncbi:Dor1-like family-domain-containing protein [Geopyxis carbonaria]|nr:Dor1-like family-domain-containing protein [Geopyxis carbonaria]